MIRISSATWKLQNFTHRKLSDYRFWIGLKAFLWYCLCGNIPLWLCSKLTQFNSSYQRKYSDWPSLQLKDRKSNYKYAWCREIYSTFRFETPLEVYCVCTSTETERENEKKSKIKEWEMKSIIIILCSLASFTSALDNGLAKTPVSLA